MNLSCAVDGLRVLHTRDPESQGSGEAVILPSFMWPRECDGSALNGQNTKVHVPCAMCTSTMYARMRYRHEGEEGVMSMPTVSAVNAPKCVA